MTSDEVLVTRHLVTAHQRFLAGKSGKKVGKSILFQDGTEQPGARSAGTETHLPEPILRVKRWGLANYIVGAVKHAENSSKRCHLVTETKGLMFFFDGKKWEKSGKKYTFLTVSQNRLAPVSKSKNRRNGPLASGCGK